MVLGLAFALGVPTAFAGLATRAPAAAAVSAPSISPAIPAAIPEPVVHPPAPARRIILPVRVYHPARPSIVMRPGAQPSVIRSLRVREPVVFLTIDDGYFPDARVASLAKAGIPMTAFLVGDAVHQ